VTSRAVSVRHEKKVEVQHGAMSVPATTLSLALVGVAFFSTEEAHRLLVLHCGTAT
jgi:hypothetical protein